mmetsp:Transcript_174/g.380  ORF Transcript_174/g.380 Transcript_174/m.380 type:complete len:107 (+) Transcript_174:202-522(+)
MLESCLERVSARSEEFFESLAKSEGNASRVGKLLLEDIERLEKEIRDSGAEGLSLLVGSSEIKDEQVVKQKLQGLDGSLREKEQERGVLHTSIEAAMMVLKQQNNS